eukprot:2157532-Pyramimonas_sp.AAC.1
MEGGVKMREDEDGGGDEDLPHDLSHPLTRRLPLPARIYPHLVIFGVSRPGDRALRQGRRVHRSLRHAWVLRVPPEMLAGLRCPGRPWEGEVVVRPLAYARWPMSTILMIMHVITHPSQSEGLIDSTRACEGLASSPVSMTQPDQALICPYMTRVGGHEFPDAAPGMMMGMRGMTGDGEGMVSVGEEVDEADEAHGS